VSVDGGVEQPGATPPLPRSIWVVALASLAGQAVQLVRQGGRLDDEISLVLSVVLGGLLVGYVSAGVVRTRTVRLVLAWVVLVLGVIGELVGLVSVDDPGHAALAVLSLATTAAALAGLTRFRGTDWYTWQRTKPRSASWLRSACSSACWAGSPDRSVTDSTYASASPTADRVLSRRASG
jgi:hypothetical protein